MPWDQASPAMNHDMTFAQGQMIRSLREQLDGVSMGTYADDVLPKWSKAEASHRIEDLNRKLEEKKARKGRK